MRLLVAIALVAACGGTHKPTQPPPDDDAVVELQCAVEQAEVYVNDRQIGQCGDLPGGIALTPGTHRIEIRHDDYHTAYYELTLHKAEHKTLQVDLAPALP